MAKKEAPPPDEATLFKIRINVIKNAVLAKDWTTSKFMDALDDCDIGVQGINGDHMYTHVTEEKIAKLQELTNYPTIPAPWTKATLEEIGLKPEQAVYTMIHEAIRAFYKSLGLDQIEVGFLSLEINKHGMGEGDVSFLYDLFLKIKARVAKKQRGELAELNAIAEKTEERRELPGQMNLLDELEKATKAEPEVETFDGAAEILSDPVEDVCAHGIAYDIPCGQCAILRGCPHGQVGDCAPCLSATAAPPAVARVLTIKVTHDQCGQEIAKSDYHTFTSEPGVMDICCNWYQCVCGAYWTECEKGNPNTVTFEDEGEPEAFEDVFTDRVQEPEVIAETQASITPEQAAGIAFLVEHGAMITEAKLTEEDATLIVARQEIETAIKDAFEIPAELLQSPEPTREEFKAAVQEYISEDQSVGTTCDGCKNAVATWRLGAKDFKFACDECKDSVPELKRQKTKVLVADIARLEQEAADAKAEAERAKQEQAESIAREFENLQVVNVFKGHYKSVGSVAYRLLEKKQRLAAIEKTSAAEKRVLEAEIATLKSCYAPGVLEMLEDKLPRKGDNSFHKKYLPLTFCRLKAIKTGGVRLKPGGSGELRTYMSGLSEDEQKMWGCSYELRYDLDVIRELHAAGVPLPPGLEECEVQEVGDFDVEVPS